MVKCRKGKGGGSRIFTQLDAPWMHPLERLSWGMIYGRGR
jgi:hypothetical protein